MPARMSNFMPIIDLSGDYYQSGRQSQQPSAQSQARNNEGGRSTPPKPADPFETAMENYFKQLSDPNSAYYQKARKSQFGGLLDLYAIANREKMKQYASQGGTSNELVNEWQSQANLDATEQANKFQTNLYTQGMGLGAGVGNSLLDYSLGKQQLAQQQNQFEDSQPNFLGSLLGLLGGGFLSPILGGFGAKTAKSIFGNTATPAGGK